MPTKIEWCDETLNPLGHGCHGPGGTLEKPNVCPYCYAQTLAKRNMRGCELCEQFIPHTHFEQLETLQRWKRPKNIFMQSMGDLFGEWVSDEWIEEVFKACEAAPQHRYLFLTKNPARYGELHDKGLLPEGSNYWFGATLTYGADEYRIAKHLPEYHGQPKPTHRNTFVSAEPILDDIEGRHPMGGFFTYYPQCVKWAILGAETGNRKDKVKPERKWIENIVEQCRTAGVPVFMKNSLAGIWGGELIREYPW